MGELREVAQLREVVRYDGIGADFGFIHTKERFFNCLVLKLKYNNEYSYSNFYWIYYIYDYNFSWNFCLETLWLV